MLRNQINSHTPPHSPKLTHAVTVLIRLNSLSVALKQTVKGDCLLSCDIMCINVHSADVLVLYDAIPNFLVC